MNLLEFIPHLRRPSQLEQVVLEQAPDLDFELTDIYLEKELNIYSNMHFFNAEEIEGKIEMEYNGKKYINLFPLDYLQDIFDQYNETGKNDKEVAQAIMNFRIKDA